MKHYGVFTVSKPKQTQGLYHDHDLSQDRHSSGYLVATCLTEDLFRKQEYISGKA